MSKEERAKIERMEAAAWLRFIEHDCRNEPDPNDAKAWKEYHKMRIALAYSWRGICRVKRELGIKKTQDPEAIKMHNEARAIITARQIELTNK